MKSGITPKKVVRDSRQFTEHAKRYVFYPTSDLDFFGSQASSPIWSPSIMKGRITLLESFPYHTQVVGEGEEALAGGNGVKLGLKTMGTDAQVKFLMGNAEGAGYMEKGMTELVSMIDVDYETADEIEQLILGPERLVPDTLIDFDLYFRSLQIEDNSPVAEIAIQVAREMHSGVIRAINYAKSYTAQIEKELREGQSGKPGIKSLSRTHEFFFHTINKPLPEDRAGVNMGNELAKAIGQVLSLQQGATTPAPTASSMEKEMELELMRQKLEAAELELEEQKEIITTLTRETEED